MTLRRYQLRSLMNVYKVTEVIAVNNEGDSVSYHATLCVVV